MVETLSKTAFAARRGVGASTVSNWISRGRLSGAALSDDGRIVVAEAERQLANLLDHARSEGTLAAVAERRAFADTPRAGPSDPPATGGVTALREQLLEIDLEKKRRQLAAEAGVYVRADSQEAERGRAIVQLIAAIENWLPELVAELGGGAEELVTMRRAWRRFREREAGAARARAQALPEFVADAA